jgi:hypothetical protein
VAEYDRASIMSAICVLISDGKGLPEICAADDMPSRSTIHKWLDEDSELSDRYARAREKQAEFYADEIITIADKAEDAQLARLQVDARKWAASKLAPKRYGDKTLNEHSGPDGAPIATVQRIERVIIDPANPDAP